MPDLREMKKYLKRDDFAEGDKVTFISAGEIKDVDFSPEKDGTKIKRVLQMDVSINDSDTKSMTLNSTTWKTLSAKWGDKTEEWVGRTTKVTFVKQIVFGKMDKVLVLEPTDEEVSWEE